MRVVELIEREKMRVLTQVGLCYFFFSNFLIAFSEVHIFFLVHSLCSHV